MGLVVVVPVEGVPDCGVPVGELVELGGAALGVVALGGTAVPGGVQFTPAAQFVVPVVPLGVVSVLPVVPFCEVPLVPGFPVVPMPVLGV